METIRLLSSPGNPLVQIRSNATGETPWLNYSINVPPATPHRVASQLEATPAEHAEALWPPIRCSGLTTAAYSI